MMEAKGFTYIEADGGWKKNKLFIPTEMLEDHPYQDFIDKFNWLAEYDFEFMSNQEKSVLILSNGYHTMELMATINEPLSNIQNEIKKTVSKLN